jgi:hypothetical protein
MTVLFRIETTEDTKCLRCVLLAANEMSFEIAVLPGLDGYHKTLTDICHIAPIMIRLDADLMEMYDDAGRTQPRKEDLIEVKKFAMSHSFGEVNLPFSAFDSIR